MNSYILNALHSSKVIYNFLKNMYDAKHDFFLSFNNSRVGAVVSNKTNMP